MTTRILKIFIPFVIISALLYQFWPDITSRLFPAINTYIESFISPAPCTHPIPYVLGTFDTKFGISQKYFLSALTDAEVIWEKPFGKNLFTYAPTDTSSRTLKVNLVYDYRQEATSKLKGLGIIVEDNQVSYDSIKVKFTTLQTNYNQAKSDFDARVQAFNQKNKDYEAEVEMWNGKGGAPKDEYNKLEQERLELNAESVELKTAQISLNNMTDELNALVVALNHLVDSLNLSVDKFNTTSSARGESYEEGVYETDGGSMKVIDIYEFSTRTMLVRVLAHELGHALGLGHVPDPKAIMAEFNKGNSMVLTKDDLDALNVRCGVK